MNLDCHWIEEKLEPFFCDRLNADENRAVQSHLENCSTCRDTIQEYRAIDPLIKKVFQQNLTMARMPRSRRSALRLAAFATVAVSIVLLLVWITPHPASPTQTARSVAPASAATAAGAIGAPPAPKIEDNAPPDRAKPEPAALDKPQAPAQVSSPQQAGKPVPDFLITDFAGYSRSLADYKGSVLIFGVLDSAQPLAVSNLQRVYETFGKNTKIRVVGVLKQRGTPPAGGKFTMAYNEGSTLLGASPSDIVIVDDSGAVRFRGTLADSQTNIVNSVRTTLHQLNIQN